MNGILYDKSCYYNGTLNWDYGRSVSTCGLNLSPVKVCYVCSHGLYIRSWSLFINLICLLYLLSWSHSVYTLLIIYWIIIDIIVVTYSVLFFCVIMYWQVLYPLWWIVGIINKLLLLLLLLFPMYSRCSYIRTQQFHMLYHTGIF
jgi:hypothetical protein